jgi:hypothetical protein
VANVFLSVAKISGYGTHCFVSKARKVKEHGPKACVLIKVALASGRPLRHDH